MPGLIGFAPIYVNGLLALLFVLVLPGLVAVGATSISNFPQRWFIVFLLSLTANHLVVTAIAALQLDPLLTYRCLAALAVAVLIVQLVRGRVGPQAAARHGASAICSRDIWLIVLTLALLSVTYLDVWRHGVPNTFEGGDVSYSWNRWALRWSQAKFPIASLGYPQFVPTIWAVTYIFTGSTEQYFAYYIYIAWIVVTVVLAAVNLGRTGLWNALVFVLVLAWLIAEIRDPWLVACLRQAYPDWVAAIFAYSGAALFVANAPDGRMDNEKIASGFISLLLLLIATATKPLFGLFAVAVLIGTCVDMVRYLPAGRRRNLLMGGAVALVAAFVGAYAVDYAHLLVARAAPYPYPLSERLHRAADLFNANFRLPFRCMVIAGLVVSPFLKRIRWLSLPLIAGFVLWAVTTSYDLRNLLGFLLIACFFPLFALARAIGSRRDLEGVRSWFISDGVVAASVALLCFAATSTLALSDEKLKLRFQTEQLSKSAGTEINQEIQRLLARGCTVFNADNYLHTISAFAPYDERLLFFFSLEPLNDPLAAMIRNASDCAAFFYPPDRTHPSILTFFADTAKERDYVTLAEGRGMVLLGPRPEAIKGAGSAKPQ
jgi:hypothetical protein